MKKYYRVVVGSVVAVVLLAVVLLCRVRQRLVVSIDGFEVYATDTGPTSVSTMCHTISSVWSETEKALNGK